MRNNGIHPNYAATAITCATCGNSFTTGSTRPSAITVDVCSDCHPFYTGKQRVMDTGGRVARFEARYGKRVLAAK